MIVKYQRFCSRKFVNYIVNVLQELLVWIGLNLV